MAKSNTSKKPISQEEYTTNKVLTVFTVCLMGVLLLMILQRLLDYANTWAVGMAVQKGLLVLGAIGVLWGLYLLVRERTGKRSAARRIICGRNVLIVSVVMVLAMSVIGYYGVQPIKALYVILPVLAVYYLVFHSYAPEFFCIALYSGAAVGLIWVVRRAQVSDSHPNLAFIAAGVMAAIAVIGLIILAAVHGKKGRFTLGGRKVDLSFSRNAYGMLVLTPVLMTVLAVLAAVAPSISLICMGVAAGYLFITAVYYTVKLM